MIKGCNFHLAECARSSQQLRWNIFLGLAASCIIMWLQAWMQLDFVGK